MARQIKRRSQRQPYPVSELARGAGLPDPEVEYRFHPTRKWRFDFAWPDELVALEVEGGIFIRGRHSRGAGMLKDFEKYNEAACLGWRIIRCSPSQARNLEVLKWLRRILA